MLCLRFSGFAGGAKVSGSFNRAIQNSSPQEKYMGWKKFLKKSLPYVQIAGTAASGNIPGAVMQVVEQVQGHEKNKSEPASIDAVKVVAASTDDHEQQIKELLARVKQLEKQKG
jgi:phosphatidate phosphatase APP1